MRGVVTKSLRLLQERLSTFGQVLLTSPEEDEWGTLHIEKGTLLQKIT